MFDASRGSTFRGSVVELQTRERARVKESKTAPISGMIASSSPKKKMYPKQSEPAPFIAQGAIVTSIHDPLLFVLDSLPIYAMSISLLML